jgi:hypothetical protein
MSTKARPHVASCQTRREFLTRAGGGFGALALTHLLGAGHPVFAALRESRNDLNPLAGRPAQYPARAKSVIFLFMEGGPSHIDLFDPKPKLNALAGQPLPASFGKVILAMGEANAPLLASKRHWK